MNKKHLSSLFLSVVLCLIGQSSQAAADLTFYYSGGDDYVAPGDYPIQFTLHNSGDEYVTSFVLNWSVNGGATQSYEFTNEFFPNNENLMDFEVPGESIDVNAQDTYDISFWISEINDISQSLSANNQVSRTVHRLDAIPEHKVLAEKVTATWCPSCPGAAIVMENLQDDFPDNLVLAYLHKSDAYEPPQYDEIAAYYGPYNNPNSSSLPQPSGLVDRYVFPITNTNSDDGENPVSSSFQWADLISTKIAQISPVHLAGSTTFTGNQLTVDIDATFQAAMTGEYRFNCFIMEDHIIANQSGSAGGPNYDHRFTVRDMLGGAWGNAAFNNPSKNSVHSHTYTYTMPSSYDTDNVSVYVIIQKYGSSPLDRDFMNVLEIGLNDSDALGLTPVSTNTCAAPAAPAISTDVNSICTGETANLNANITAPAGFYFQWQRNGSDLAGENGANISTSTPGNYTVYLTDGDSGAPCNSDESNGVVIVLGTQPNFTDPVINITGTTVSFNTNVQGGATMAWSFGNGDSSTVEDPTYTFSEPGTYFVCPTAINDCGTFGLCIPVTIPYPFELNAKVFLEGAYIGGGTMNTDAAEFMPLDHPYNETPYNFSGGKTLGFVPNDVVDWVLVEARIGTPSTNNNSATITLETRAGLLKSDGSIVDLDGVTPLGFRNLNMGSSYHFAVRHRNHLDIISANPVVASASMSYDFTTSTAQVAGSQQIKAVGSGDFAMYGGDYNHDGVIQTTDYDVWKFLPAQVSVYTPTDGTLDGVVQATDYDLWFPNGAKIGHIEVQF